VEAIADSLMKLQTEEVKVNVIHKGVGAVTESDVLLAAASNAVIIGFHIHANKQARESAQREQVEIKSYRVIYDVIDDVKKALEGMLRPEISEEILGELEVRNTFKITAVGTIAGCYVTEGKIERLSKIKVFHEGVEVFDGELESLKRFKDDAREVSASFECGLKIKNFNDIKVGDIIQTYKLVETKRTLLV
jgi:translation initiation factor IF-2